MPSPRPEIKGEGAGEGKRMAREMYNLFGAAANGAAEFAAKCAANFVAGFARRSGLGSAFGPALGSTAGALILAPIGGENAADQSLCGLSRHVRQRGAAASIHWHESRDSNIHGRCQACSRRFDAEPPPGRPAAATIGASGVIGQAYKKVRLTKS
jgi:hypothetical protein